MCIWPASKCARKIESIPTLKKKKKNTSNIYHFYSLYVFTREMATLLKLLWIWWTTKRLFHSKSNSITVIPFTLRKTKKKLPPMKKTSVEKMKNKKKTSAGRPNDANTMIFNTLVCTLSDRRNFFGMSTALSYRIVAVALSRTK